MLDDELPGMWEHADFTGGQESSSIVEEVAKAFEIPEEYLLKYLDTETPVLMLRGLRFQLLCTRSICPRRSY